MTTPALKTTPDFNPALRDPSRFGYSPVRDALYSVQKFLGLTAPLPHSRALDTNHWTCQNIQSWQQVAQAIVLQYNKSTEGVTFSDIDSQLATLDGKAAGLLSLLYHFFRRNLNGTAQWNYFKSKTESLINQIGGKKIVIIDMETADGVGNPTGNNNLKLFCTVAKAEGYKVGLYINAADWVSFGLEVWVNPYVDFYILAKWAAGNAPALPPGMDAAKLAMQQEGIYADHSWIAPIPGLVPSMDCNLLLWTLAQWEAFTGQKYSPQTPPPVDPLPGVFMPTFSVKTDTLNIRAGHSINAAIVGTKKKGDIIAALDVYPETAASVWVKLAENQWVALTHASVVYLTHL